MYIVEFTKNYKKFYSFVLVYVQYMLVLLKYYKIFNSFIMTVRNRIADILLKESHLRDCPDKWREEAVDALRKVTGRTQSFGRILNNNGALRLSISELVKVKNALRKLTNEPYTLDDLIVDPAEVKLDVTSEMSAA